MDASATKPNSKESEHEADRAVITNVYWISLACFIVPLILLCKAYFPYALEGGKKAFLARCINPSQLIKKNQPKGSVDISRIQQLEADTCEYIVWKNELASGISWAWNLVFILIPIASTVILTVESNPKLKAVFLAIASSSTVLVSKTEVDQWKFQSSLAGEGRILISRLNYGASNSAEFEKMVKDYQNLISHSSIGQSFIKSDPNPVPTPTSNPASL